VPRSTRLLVSGFTIAVALALAIGTADARRLAFSENHFLSHFRAITFASGEISLVCALSIEGSFHERTLEKIVRSLIGYISEARIKRPCSGGEMWVLTTQEGRTESLPWHILYERFIGALPSITGIEITLDNIAWLLTVLGANCLYRASTTSPLRGITNREAGGRATGLRLNEASSIPKAEGSFLCPSTIVFRGAGIIGTQVGYREITVTLVA
jgi:hypothetical protein